VKESDYDQLTKAAGRTLLRVAREALRSEVGNAPFEPPEIPYELERPGGAFVTLKREEQLRGCIGALENTLPIWQTVEKSARQAATIDYRFDPVRPEELPQIRIEVSVISPLERVPEPRNSSSITIGQDGLCIRYKQHSGVLLPQVAADRAWSAEEFLEHVCLKADLKPDCWQRPEAELFRFTAVVFDERSIDVEY